MTEREKLLKERETVLKEISQLENRQKVLLNKDKVAERRARNHRLIERGVMLESMFPELTVCDNSRVLAFLISVSRLPQMTDLLAKAAEPSDTG